MEKDYYKILGVSPTADEKEINKAYKKLMKENHPDLSKPENRHLAEEQSKLLNEARDTLLNPELRRRYDISRTSPPSNIHSSQNRNFNGERVYQRVDFASSFDDFFGEDLFNQIFREFFQNSSFAGNDFFFNRVHSRRSFLPEELFEIQLPINEADQYIKYINNLFQYYNLELLEQEYAKGKKYYTLWCLFSGSAENMEEFRKTLKKKNVKIVKKKVANSR